MWIPTHIRQGNASCIVLALAFCLPSAGCSSMPVLENERTALLSRANDQIPVPEFDEAVPTTRVAGKSLASGIIPAQRPFSWEPLAESSGRRAIETAHVGDGGFRTLVVGSLAGDDPLAITLAEKLAQHLHENAIILGGVDVTVIRNLNPDGEALFKMVNEHGVYLNREFHKNLSQPAQQATTQPEVRAFLKVLDEHQPQRVIHLRTYGNGKGVIAASAGAETVARESAEWLGFELIQLPGASADGTLERFLSSDSRTEIVTLAIPATIQREDVWDTYGGSLLNLIQSHDFEARQAARKDLGTETGDLRSDKNSVRNRRKRPN